MSDDLKDAAPIAALDARTDRLAEAIAGDGSRSRSIAAVLGDVFEELLGFPEVDHVLGGIPVPIWARLRDLSTRLARVEDIVLNDGLDAVLVPEEADAQRREMWSDELPSFFDITLQASSEGQGPLIVVPRAAADRRRLRDDLVSHQAVAGVYVLPVRSEAPPSTPMAVDVFGNRLRPGIEVAFAEDAGFFTGTIKSIGPDGFVFIALDPDGAATIERHPRNVCVRP